MTLASWVLCISPQTLAMMQVAIDVIQCQTYFT